jgi:prepilin-type N-terminal cleavage/methylation domain-containing protein
MKLLQIQYKNKKITSRFHRGFTLPELIVSIAIMIIITTVVLAQYRKFDSNIILTSLSYDIGLSVRKAQSYGLSVKGASTGVSVSFDLAHGVHFDTANPQSYLLFADVNSDFQYTPATPNIEKVEGLKIQGGYKISKLCTLAGVVETCTVTSLDITFKRPDPDATVYANGILTPNDAIIYIQSPQNTSKKIIVRSTGQISIQ